MKEYVEVLECVCVEVVSVNDFVIGEEVVKF